MKISAVVLTRGGVDLARIVESLRGFDEIRITNDGGLQIYGRYAALEEATNETVYVQDDDCIVDTWSLLRQYERKRVLCNMPAAFRSRYRDGIALVGWGAVFHRGLAYCAFERYDRLFKRDALFLREADRVFTGLNDLQLADVAVEHLPWAQDPDRMSTEPRHERCLEAIRKRIYACR